MDWLLRILNADKNERKQLIYEFHDFINSDKALNDYSEFEYDFLSDLEMQLINYEPNPEWRVHPSYFDDEKLEQILINAISELEKYKKDGLVK